MKLFRLIDNTLANRLGDQPHDAGAVNVRNGGDDFKPALKCPKCGRDMVVRLVTLLMASCIG